MKTTWKIQQSFSDDAVSAVQIKVWHKHFEDVENLLKMTHILEGLQ